MKYNTQLDKLKLPEYGRHIQEMVEYCVKIEDREERNACAYTIASIMRRLFPDLDQETDPYNADIDRKIWNQMNIMSDFKLDVDFPCEVITRENARVAPEAIAYSKPPYRMRHYGKLIQEMARKVADMPEGPMRDEAINLVAYQMKKLLFLQNKEGVDDSVVARDLAEITDGKICPDIYTFHLRDFVAEPEEVPVAKTTKKKKKKK